MLNRTEGIVLKNTVFGEADLIVTYLTCDFGLLNVFAKSPRKIKSRFGSSLEPLTYSTLSFIGKEDAGLPRLTQSDIIRPFHTLREDFRCFVSISEMLELNLHFLPERENNEEIFELLLNTLLKIESDRGNKLLYLYYKIKFLEITGYLPRLDACGRCGRKPVSNGSNNFYISHGSIICNTCIGSDSDAIKLSHSAARFYKSILQWHFTALDRIKAPENLLTEIACVMDSHIRYMLVKPLKSSDFSKI
jgi:DNA repair protein RecO (recombination protein O)